MRQLELEYIRNPKHRKILRIIGFVPTTFYNGESYRISFTRKSFIEIHTDNSVSVHLNEQKAINVIMLLINDEVLKIEET